MDFFKIAMIAAGGYFVLKALGVDLLGGALEAWLPPSDEPPAEGDVVPTTLPGQPSGEQLPVTSRETERYQLASKMLQLAQAQGQYQEGGGRMGYDHWNWVYQKVTGSFGPAWESVVQGKERNELLTLADFLALIGYGPSGLHGLGRAEPAGYERSNAYYE